MLKRRIKILLTGNKGFLGKFLFRELSKKKNYKIKCADFPDYDLTKIEDCVRATKNVDVVINTAGLVLSRVEQVERSAEILYSNLLINLQILEGARINKVKKVILISSMTAYPEKLRSPLKEELIWNGGPNSANAAYGITKRLLITAGWAYKKQYNLEVNCVIFPNLYGPEDKFNYNPPPLVPNVISQIYDAKKNNAPFIIGGNNGKQILDLLYIEDAVKAILLVLKKNNLPEIINIGSNQKTRIKDIFQIIARNMEFEGEIKWKNNIRLFPRYLDVSKMKKFLRWEPKTKTNKGLQKTIKWFLKTYDKK